MKKEGHSVRKLISLTLLVILLLIFFPHISRAYWPSPHVVTKFPGDITIDDFTTESVVLNGNLLSLGRTRRVDVSFEWGLDTNYGNETNYEMMTATGAFSTHLSGLAPDTTYHFRAKAVGRNTRYGTDVQFTSPPIITYNITASVGAEGSIDPSGVVTVFEGNDQSFTITPDTGYYIADVMVDGISVGAVTNYDFINVTADHTIYAVFLPITYTITASTGANGSIDPSGAVTVNHGDTQSFAVTADTDYCIADVLVDGVSVGTVIGYDFININADHTIDATFLPAYTITASAGANGSIEPSGAVTVIEGNDQSFTITADTGYYIADVLVDGVSVGTVAGYDFIDVAADHTINATFQPVTYTIAASAGAGGSINPSGVLIVNHGDNQSFTITAYAGYYIADVMVDGVSVGAITGYDFIDVTADHTISAILLPVTYTISASAGSGGSISPSGDMTVNHGNNQSFTITADNGNDIVDVIVDGVSVGGVASYNFINVTTDHTIHASFLINQPPVAYSGLDVEVRDIDEDGVQYIFLDGSASYDPDGTIVSYEWKLGDSILSTDAVFTRQFNVGRYAIILTVTDDDGATASDMVMINVKRDSCFIATAAYGTPMAEEIDVLRDFRDRYLLTNPVGEVLVELYYNTSPPVADFINDHSALKQVVRAGLEPVISVGTVIVYTTLAQKIAVASSMVLVCALLAVWFGRRGGKSSIS